MTYIDLINRFWKMNTEYTFSTAEIALYFKILDIANNLGWKEPLSVSTKRLCAEIDISHPTFFRARQRLCDAGLLRVKSRGTRKSALYWYHDSLKNFTNHDTNHDTNRETNRELIMRPYIRLDIDQTRDSIVDTNVSTKSSHDDVPYQEIVSLYHSMCPSYKRLSKLTDKRKAHIRARWREHESLDKFKAVFENMENSSFLKGDNNREWQADFDWVMKNESNFLKVLEGKYNKEVKNEIAQKGNRKSRKEDEIELYKSPAGKKFSDRELEEILYNPERDA